MFRCLLWAIAAAMRPRVLPMADNLCLRHGWGTSLLIVKPETVLRWHRQGWRTYWRSSCWSCSAASRGRASRMRTGVSGFWRIGGSSLNGTSLAPPGPERKERTCASRSANIASYVGSPAS
jgi:hypothetical protein